MLKIRKITVVRFFPPIPKWLNSEILSTHGLQRKAHHQSSLSVIIWYHTLLLGRGKDWKTPQGSKQYPIMCTYSHISIRMSLSCSDRGERRNTPGIYSVSCISVVRSACKFTAGKHSGFQHRSCAWIDPPHDSNIWDAFISLDKHW